MMGLQYEVFVSKRPGIQRSLPPGHEHLRWVPTSFTLIYGDKEAVLVDAPLTVAATKEVLDWVVASGKDLKFIYITHPHADHYFGAGAILEKFSNAKAIATKETVSGMKKEIARERSDDPFWRKLFVGQLPDELVEATTMESDEFELEGKKLMVVRTGHTDTDDTSTLFVPSIGLAVTGDATYNNVHLYLVESNTKQLRLEWIAALDKIELLKPKAVVSGHKDPSQNDDPRVIEQTRTYLKTLEKLNDETETTEELYYRMLDLYPTSLNPGSLWGAVNMLKG
jgi:glyoxylase-like metal-dependent hydrolase (beta-lactamase superfamily II)